MMSISYKSPQMNKMMLKMKMKMNMNMKTKISTSLKLNKSIKRMPIMIKKIMKNVFEWILINLFTKNKQINLLKKSEK